MGEEREERRHGKSKSFWTGARIAFAVVFVVGFALGTVVTNQFIDPTLNASVFVEKTSLEQLNAELDKQADSYYSCLQQSGIDPNTC